MFRIDILRVSNNRARPLQDYPLSALAIQQFSFTQSVRSSIMADDGIKLPQAARVTILAVV